MIHTANIGICALINTRYLLYLKCNSCCSCTFSVFWTAFNPVTQLVVLHRPRQEERLPTAVCIQDPWSFPIGGAEASNHCGTTLVWVYPRVLKLCCCSSMVFVVLVLSALFLAVCQCRNTVTDQGSHNVIVFASNAWDKTTFVFTISSLLIWLQSASRHVCVLQRLLQQQLWQTHKRLLLTCPFNTSLFAFYPIAAWSSQH